MSDGQDIRGGDQGASSPSVADLLYSDKAMRALAESAWTHAGTSMPRTAEGGRRGLRAALVVFDAEGSAA